MKNSNRRLNNNGVTIVAAIAIMLIMAVLGLVLSSMLGTTSRSSLESLRSAQAFGLAQAGLNWSMMRLTGLSDWTTAVDQFDIPLGLGTFDVVLTNKTSTRMTINITGEISGTDGMIIKRTMSQDVRNLLSAFLYALFCSRARLVSGSQIVGDMWASQNVIVASGCSTQNVYHPSTTTVYGAGTYIDKPVNPPYPAFPLIDPSYYTNLMTTYDTMIDNNSSIEDKDLLTDLVLNGETLNYRDFNTSGNIIISGYGFIVANRNMSLHSRNLDQGTLTISPSGGNIVFISARNLTVNSVEDDTPVVAFSGVRLYSRNQTAVSQLLTIQKSTTNIDRALILARMRIIVKDSAYISNSTLFLDRRSTNIANNYLEINGSVTLSGACALISTSSRSPSLRIISNSTVEGLVYLYDTTQPTGTVELNNATIRGSVVARLFLNNRIIQGLITLDLDNLPDPLPEGFIGYASKEPNSWDGN